MPLIDIRRLTKLYRMGDTIVRALDGVDLSIEAGEFVAITGASGSGKSTMMHLLGCLDRPTGGTYVLNGRNVGEMSDRALADLRSRYIGFVFQTFNLINRTTALDNVTVPLFYARKFGSKAARTALERVGLGQRASHKPNELSGGERQRVAIARAIVNDPVLLMADEPTGNLDSRTGEQIMQIFHELNAQGVTIVLVTHEPDVAMQAKRIIQMRDGKIISDRTTEEVRAESPESTGYAPARSTAAAVAGSHSATATLPPPPRVSPRAAAAAAAPAPGADDGLDLTPRAIPGSLGVLVSGILAIGLLVLSGVCLGLTVATGWKPAPDKPNEIPPPGVWVPALVMLAALFFAVVTGFVALFWSRVVLKRARTEPGNWQGIGRARLGGWLGIATLAIPVVLPLLQWAYTALT